ncbi:MAG: SDR family NAD(P)-dependent oxidoreductase [Steroidobacteraceae bacterium]|jgi:NAD(P)-dependent dehydrogenase (short-subunit alcohol dehydrogenase family)|nr:SDR family NAD(P)-dependent oxidoreductase [Steroidobacteraceae bacterium]
MGTLHRIALLGLWFMASVAPARAADDAPTVLVTGANRGIGLEFARQYAARGWRVIATAREPRSALELQALAGASGSRVIVERLDVTRAADVEALAARYRGQPIDVLINNAGLTGDFRGEGQRLGSLDYAEGEAMMAVNAFGPLRVSEALYENVRMSRQKKIVAITALLGLHSFGYGNFDGAYWYKVTKAAMNAAMANLAREAARDGVVVALLAPGEVAVEKVRDPGPEFITPEVSIRGMIGVIDGLTPRDSAAVIRYNGKRYEF